MCATSQIYDYGQKTLPAQPWWNQLGPAVIGPDNDILKELREQREILQRFIAMVEAARLFDRAAKEPDCEQPTKAALMDQVMERLAKIEKALGL